MTPLAAFKIFLTNRIWAGDHQQLPVNFDKSVNIFTEVQRKSLFTFKANEQKFKFKGGHLKSKDLKSCSVKNNAISRDCLFNIGFISIIKKRICIFFVSDENTFLSME